MDLRSTIVTQPLASRFHFDAAQNIFFIDFENLRLRKATEIEEIRSLIEDILAPLGRKVPAVVNYHGFDIQDDLLEAYANMIQGLMERRYSQVTRYATNTFLRAKLGNALTARQLSPKIFDSAEEARAGLSSP
jgi:propionate CoA-transferase